MKNSLFFSEPEQTEGVGEARPKRKATETRTLSSMWQVSRLATWAISHVGHCCPGVDNRKLQSQILNLSNGNRGIVSIG